jgi:hypothetical protein
VTQLADVFLFLGDEVLPAAGRQVRNLAQPVRIKLRALVLLQEVLTVNAIVAVRQTQQTAFIAHQRLLMS